MLLMLSYACVDTTVAYTTLPFCTNFNYLSLLIINIFNLLYF